MVTLQPYAKQQERVHTRYTLLAALTVQAVKPVTMVRVVPGEPEEQTYLKTQQQLVVPEVVLTSAQTVLVVVAPEVVVESLTEPIAVTVEMMEADLGDLDNWLRPAQLAVAVAEPVDITQTLVTEPLVARVVLLDQQQ